MSTGHQTPEQPDDPNQPWQAAGPPPGYGQQPVYRPGQPPMRPDDEKLWAIGAHLGPIILGFIAPLIVWLVFKDRSAYLDRQGKEALNFQLTLLIGFIVSLVLVFVLIGFLLMAVVGIGGLVLMIVATVKVANHEDYRYPVNIRFIK